LANSTIRIAFLQAKPISTMKMIAKGNDQAEHLCSRAVDVQIEAGCRHAERGEHPLKLRLLVRGTHQLPRAVPELRQA
jgi:hypothetical protein